MNEAQRILNKYCNETDAYRLKDDSFQAQDDFLDYLNENSNSQEEIDFDETNYFFSDGSVILERNDENGKIFYHA